MNQTHVTQLPPPLLRLRGLMARLGIGKTTIYRFIAEADFPRPIKLGTKISVWRSDEVEAWVEKRRGGSHA